MRLYTLVLLFSTLFILGCGGSSENEEPPPLTSSIEIFLDKDLLTVAEQTEVNLGAKISTRSTYVESILWQQVSGAAVSLNTPENPSTTFMAPTVLLTDGEQELLFKVTVTGQDNSTVSADVRVLVSPVNQLPIVVATVERTMDVEQVVMLAATATDSDGSIVSYFWQQTAGESVAVEDFQQAKIQFSTKDITSDILSFTVTARDNEGETLVKELSIKVTADIPDVITAAELITKSGVTTLIEWQNIDNNDELNFEVLQITGQQALVFNSLGSEGIYFDAPIVVDEAKTYQLSLSITDESASQFNIPISLTVNPNSGSFSDVETIFTMDEMGINVDEFSTQDVDNDGIADIIAYHDEGVSWYKNYGDLAIESSPVHIHSKNFLRYGSEDQHFFKDVDDDSYVDFVFIDYDPQRNNLIVKYKQNDGEGQFSQQFDIAELVGSGSNLDAAKLLLASQKSQQNLFSVVTYSYWPAASKLFIVEQQGDDFVTYEPVAISGKILDVKNCQLSGVTETAMFFHVDGGTTQSFYLASSKDNYQSLILLSTDSGWDANLLCYQMPDKSYRLFFNYGYGNSREIVYSQDNGYEELTVATGLTGGEEANFQLLDINQDGVDEVIKYGSWGNASIVFSFDVNSATDLFKPMANFRLTPYSSTGMGKMTYWPESKSFHFFRENNNRFELSELYTLGESVNYQSVGYSFKAPNAIGNVKAFNNDLVINTNLDNGKRYQSNTFSLNNLDNKLALNTVNDIANFGDQIPTLIDINSDGIDDAIFTQTEDEYDRGCGYWPDVNVVVRYGMKDGGFAESETLNIVPDCPPYIDTGEDKMQRVVVQDINLDGWLDLGMRNSYIDYFDEVFAWDVTTWWFYNPESAQYVKQTNPLYNTDTATYPQSQKLIGDVTADGLTDVFKLAQPEKDYLLGGIRGIPSAYVALEDGSFTDLIELDENILFKFTMLADVNLDGQPDYIAHVVYPENEAENIATGTWYRWNASGDFEKITIPLVSQTYVDLNGDGNSYFVNNEQAEKLIKYRFDSKIEIPVVAEVISNEALPSNGQRLLVDIDGDNDLDIIFWDNQKVYMMRNLHH